MRRQKRILCLGLLGLLVWLTPANSSARAATQQTAAEKTQPVALSSAKEELLGELSPETRLAGLFGPDTFYLSPDGRRFAAHGKTNKNKWVVVVDGKAGPEFEEVVFSDHSKVPGVGQVFFSPNSQHAVYEGHTRGGEEGWAVVLDGKAGPEFDLVDHRLQFSMDSEHLAYRAMRGRKWFMVVDGKEGPEFLDMHDPVFSLDSKHLAYRALTTENKCVVVLDGEARPAELEGVKGSCFSHWRSSGLSFSPDGQRFAYQFSRGHNKWAMMVDGKEGIEFQEIRDPLFSPDGQHVAYRAQKGRDKWVMVLDGLPDPEFAYVEEKWTFSSDGKHLAYKAKTGSNKWVVVLDGQPGPEFEKIPKGPFFSTAGSRLAYEVLEGAKNFVVEDGKPDPEFDSVPFPFGKGEGHSPWGSSVRGFSFSPNGRHVSYIARRGQKLVVSQDGQAGPEFPFILAGPVFSTDSQHAAYVGWEHDAISMVLDGKTEKKISVSEGKPLYTQSGRQTAVDRDTAWDNAGEVFGPLVPLWPVFFAGELFTTMAAKSVNFVEHMTFSPDGQRLAYVVGRGGHIFDGKEHSRAQRRVILDGREGRQYDVDALINLTFCSDSSHFAFEVHNADKGKSFVVLDGQEGKPYDELLTNKMGWWQPWAQGTLRFRDDNSVTYLAREGRKFYRVTQPLP